MGCSSSKPNARAADPADVDVAVAEDDARAAFYSDTIPRPESFDPAIFERSVASAHRGKAPSAAARDSYMVYESRAAADGASPRCAEATLRSKMAWSKDAGRGMVSE